ncbi:DNA repair protein RecN [Paraliobacillus sp. PM-2]|uniref:DNA repair protein RecN n=1 Tax=Paraliobacillus sp. PM-2 TaxID=1462524 RepID=UPI00061CC455|nr:DNA repair protein RecN [Paraliobacillus sp. PM-2]CQR46778.1 DNA repair protein RecN [Paraliobacillus sp. PM-2]
MLTELSIKDFAIIEELTITFKKGLTVLTGETGAGKSIIIDAIELLAGGRGSVEFVRHGAKKASLEGLFTIDNPSHPIYTIATEFGIDIDTDGMVVLSRTISSNGKSICRVNGHLVTLGLLKEFGKVLIDIHTQHETQSLMDVERHIELLDLYNKKQMQEAKQDYQSLYQKLTAIQNRYRQLNENEQEMAQRLDLLTFQLKELQEADLSPGEDEQLRKEREKLLNYERIFTGVRDAYEALSGEQRAIDWLGLALSGLETVSEYDASFSDKKEQFLNHFYLIEEMSIELRNYLDSLEYDSDRLNELESRLNEINRLQKKYGPTVDAMLEYASSIEDEIDEIKDKDSSIEKLEQELAEIGQDVLVEAKHLHDLRVQAANYLKQTIHQELEDLYLEKATFDIKISTKKGKVGNIELDGKPVQLGENGYDHVRFLISTNPGEPVKEMNKVASGGELSRIMLALKKIFAHHQGVTSVIFDEVDTGVSGRVAQAIAEKIYNISTGSQVLCITHLPQVASMADTHLLIQKQIKDNRTITSVESLSTDKRITEIGRMITGTELTATSREHARELIDRAEQLKQIYI